MLKLTKIGMKISGKEYYGVTNPSFLKIWVQSVDNMWEEELGEMRMSACGLQWNRVEGLSGLGLHFCQWCWWYCPNWWDHECWKVKTGFNSSCHSFWKAPDCEWFLFFSMITISSTLLMQWNHIWKEKQLIKHWQLKLNKKKYFLYFLFVS